MTVVTATERFKRLFSNAIEHICVLEEQLELAKIEIEKLKAEKPEETSKEVGDVE